MPYKLSLRASDTAELIFEDCRIPKANLLAASKGLKSPLMCLSQARYGIAWGALGAGMAALHEACRLLLDEGLDMVYTRHEQVARYCRGMARMRKLRFYPVSDASCSPTVTALRVPKSLGWEELDRRLREHGMGVGGSLGPLAGKVFRIGHMGTQANLALVKRGMDVLAEVLKMR